MKMPGSRYSLRGRGIGRPALSLLLPVLAVSVGCSLDENPTSAITPDNFYQNEEEVLGGVTAAYAELRNTLWAYYNLSEISTDEMIVPTRGQDWFDNGRWIEIHEQNWSANSPAGLDDINGTWNNLFAGVAKSNVVLEALNNVTVANQDVYAAELRALRAFYYYMLMDMFGGVPIATDTEILARPRASRAELFAFIEQELLEVRETLPLSWPADLHGRFTRGAADAILASMYLNAEVFTGTVTTAGLQKGQARWQDAIDAADRVINSGAYALATDWDENFAPDNYLSPENILVVKHLNETGLGLNFVMRALHYNHISPTPWNGFSTLASTYFSFDPDDQRTDIFLVGPQVNLETGQPITDRSGAPLIIVPTINDIHQATESEGVRIVKWRLDPEHVAEHNNNDVAYFRLGEMYLIKAEALNELGNTAGAVDLVNTLRARVFSPPKPLSAGNFTQASFRDQMLLERLFELTAEARRRQDLVRHGKFTDTWEFKGPTEPFRILMPIPQPQLDTNPELQQNPGY